MKPRYQLMRNAWPKDKMIAHWHAVLAKPTPYPLVHRFAAEALEALRADPPREPGEDD